MREDDLSAREQRGLARCRRAREKGRRVRGRPIASGAEGVLVDLRGVLGHVPADEVADRPPPRSLWSGAGGGWEGWVVALGDDLVHLSGRRSGDDVAEGAIRRGAVTSIGRAGARVRLDDDRSDAVLPWEELSWQPALDPPRLDPGDQVVGRVVGITLEGPILSPRAVVPTPWPAIALALPPGTEVAVRVQARAGGHVELRTQRAPRATTIVAAQRLPSGVAPGAMLDARVVEVNAIAGILALDSFSLRVDPSSRAPRPAPGAGTPGPRGPEQAASGSGS